MSRDFPVEDTWEKGIPGRKVTLHGLTLINPFSLPKLMKILDMMPGTNDTEINEEHKAAS